MADRIRNISLSKDLRTIMLPYNVIVPVEGQVIVLVHNSKFPFEILSVDRFCGGQGSDSLGMVFEVDGADIVDWDDADSTGEIVANEGSSVESEANGSSDFVAEGGSLRVTLQNLTSDVSDLVFQVNVRRTDDNVIVSD